MALSRSDSSHYNGFASKGNPGFLQHSSGQSAGLAIPAAVHPGRSRSLRNFCGSLLHKFWIFFWWLFFLFVVSKPSVWIISQSMFHFMNVTSYVCLKIENRTEAGFNWCWYFSAQVPPLNYYFFIHNHFLSCSDGRSSALVSNEHMSVSYMSTSSLRFVKCAFFCKYNFFCIQIPDYRNAVIVAKSPASAKRWSPILSSL